MLRLARFALIALSLSAPVARADQPSTLSNNTRYLSLGDSLAAGYGAIPTTNGYAYLLYQHGVFDQVSNTSFANAAVPGTTSKEVLDHQVPQAPAFQPNVVTMSVGGNDLLSLVPAFLANPPLPPEQLQQLVQNKVSEFGGNFFNILVGLCGLEDVSNIYVGNLYAIQNLPGLPFFLVEQVVSAFNGTVANVAAIANATFCANKVKIADVHAAFSGSQEGLLLINRKGAGAFEVHPTNAGYRAMAAAFEAVAVQ